MANDGVSPTFEAFFQLQGKTRDNENLGSAICSRILVLSNHIGCLLGKGGNIISEMQNHTWANICIFHKEELPKCASQNEELVPATRDALIRITKG